MKKGIVLPLLILTLASTALILGAFYFGKKSTDTTATSFHVQASPIPFPTDETANWETYIDGKYGFLIKYPETSVLSSHGGTPHEFSILIERAGGGVRIGIQTDGPYDASDTFDLNDEINGDLGRADDSKKINFHGKPAVSLKYTVEQDPQPPHLPYRQMIVYLESRKSKILLTYYGDGNNELLFDQILSTFRFVD